MEERMLFEDMVKEYVEDVLRDFTERVQLDGATCELRSRRFLKNGNGLRIELVIKTRNLKKEENKNRGV